MIFAAGVLTGILGGTEDDRGDGPGLVSVIPTAPAACSRPGRGHVMPLSLVFTPDAYYFGVATGARGDHRGVRRGPRRGRRAAILGQMTTGFPLSPLTASTFILLGLTESTSGSTSDSSSDGRSEPPS